MRSALKSVSGRIPLRVGEGVGDALERLEQRAGRQERRLHGGGQAAQVAVERQQLGLEIVQAPQRARLIGVAVQQRAQLLAKQPHVLGQEDDVLLGAVVQVEAQRAPGAAPRRRRRARASARGRAAVSRSSRPATPVGAAAASSGPSSGASVHTVAAEHAGDGSADARLTLVRPGRAEVAGATHRIASPARPEGHGAGAGAGP